MTGSSPLTRGKLCRAIGLVGAPRLIPAHAGKTSIMSPSLPEPGAHPRSRGENRLVPVSPHEHLGSSPLTRGKPISSLTPFTPTGLIPAHAAKTACGRADRIMSRAHPRSRGENLKVSALPPATAAHPRSRGENAAPASWSCALLGSSPLTRGKLAVEGEAVGVGGLIPAHAGKT